MKFRAAVVCVSVLSIAVASGAARAQDAIAAFYKSKPINLYIGSTVGGGYDSYARLLARHIAKYIPGAPNIIPANMTGAGGHVLAGFMANLAAKDGTAISPVPRNRVRGRMDVRFWTGWKWSADS